MVPLFSVDRSSRGSNRELGVAGGKKHIHGDVFLTVAAMSKGNMDNGSHPNIGTTSGLRREECRNRHRHCCRGRSTKRIKGGLRHPYCLTNMRETVRNNLALIAALL